VEQVFANPIHPYTEALLQAIPRADHASRRGRRLAEIGGAPPNLAHLPRGCSFEPRCFLGNGREQCLEHAPEPRTVAVAGRLVTAECHFAQERVALPARAEGA
jgi:oligopeptide/dipeptide ABC transporter ATP-binding protein